MSDQLAFEGGAGLSAHHSGAGAAQRARIRAARPTPLVHSLRESVRQWQAWEMPGPADGAARILANVQAREKLR